MTWKKRQLNRLYWIIDWCKKHILHTYNFRPMDRFIKDTLGKNLIGCEIGVYRGEHTKVMLHNLPIKKLYCIDPYIGYTDGSGIKTNNVKEIAKQNLKDFSNKIVFIYKKSEECYNLFKDGSLDFVYIDGNHSYENVKQDIELYFPKIRKGCIIGGHDFSTKYFGVCKAVIEFAENNGFRVMGDKNNNDWWIKKQKVE